MPWSGHSADFWHGTGSLTINSPSSGIGLGPEDVVIISSAIAGQWVDGNTVTQFTDLFSTSARFDSASYLSIPEGAIFYDVQPFFRFSREPGSPTPEVAQHIFDAFNAPERTYPAPSVNKFIPGRSGSDPLHRLFWDTQRRADNRSDAIKACETEFPNQTFPNLQYPSDGISCDEFPFASTYEGAAMVKYEIGAIPNEWSARPLNAAQNSLAGSNLSSFYSNDRILDWRDPGDELRDDFYIEVS
jgi:deoxyribonuclease NucA/NucB